MSSDTSTIRKEDWAGEVGARWLEHLDRFEGMIAPIGDALLSAAALKPGQEVLDIGCGGGATTIALARAVGTAGTATGLDISPALAAEAAARAKRAGITNVAYITADATTAQLKPASYDLIFSRFGVMFFDEPVRAFANIRSSMKAEGRLVFACWAPTAENQWITEVIGAISKFVVLPPPVPRTPGPFAFAEPDYVKRILSDAGYAAVEVNAWRGVQYVGGKGATPQVAADFILNALSAAAVARAQPPDLQRKIRLEIEDRFSRAQTPEGIAMNSTAWFVFARPA